MKCAHHDSIHQRAPSLGIPKTMGTMHADHVIEVGLKMVTNNFSPLLCRFQQIMCGKLSESTPDELNLDIAVTNLKPSAGNAPGISGKTGWRKRRGPGYAH